MSGTSGMGFEPAHDTGLYDPAVHDNQIVAMYETDEQARAAQSALVSNGVPSSAIKVVARTSDGTAGESVAATDDSVWGSIKSLFVPDDERTAYTHAVGRGHAMLVVTPSHDMDRQSIIMTLEATDPVDFDARLEQWRQEGYDTSTVHGDYAASTAYASQPAAVATPAAALDRGQTGSETDTIKVMEERLRVGKREVAGGAVRIRSYVVERPVEEKVTLHEERITVDRRPVDRVATSADLGAFQERTIEARATSEEAVISKEARVVEEIGLHKQASDREETVRDTVRRTEVEIEGDTAATSGTITNVPGSASTPVATPGATSSGTNAPRT